VTVRESSEPATVRSDMTARLATAAILLAWMAGTCATALAADTGAPVAVETTGTATPAGTSPSSPPHRRCLSPEERRTAIAAHKVIPLARAMRAVRARVNGELLRASLCEQDHRLVYVLTLFARNGKVTRATVDAASGTMIGGR
jgi:uncharacterized membrane protein YkoI